MYKNMSNNTNNMLAQRRTSYSSYARTSETGLTLLSSHG